MRIRNAVMIFLAAAAGAAQGFKLQDDPYEFEQWGTIERDGKVTFALHAPGKESVSLIGDFNGWSPDAHPMTRDGNGTWLITLDMAPGTYLYQYLVNSNQPIADPYGRDILWKDGNSNETWRSERAFTVLEVSPEPFVWKAADYRRPPLDNLIVYELHLEDFAGHGAGFTGLIEKLDYIADLGFTAIGPMPFHEFPGDSSWGYNPAFHFAPETVYGTPTELKQLIDAAHQRGLAVIMDLVLNHMDGNGALHALYGTDYEASPFFRLFDGDNWGFPDIEQNTPATKRYTADVIQMWLTDYRIDGIRYDATRFTEWSGYNDWGAGWYAFIGKRTDLDSFHIAEHMPSDPELINQTDMDTTWHDYFRWRLRDMIEHGYLDKTEFENVLNPLRIGFTNGLQRMAYTESHDEERVMYELMQRGYDEPERVRRAIMALALTLTAPGTAMIYSGQEFGEFTRKYVGPNPLQWDLLETATGRTIRDATRKLVHLRRSSPALQRGRIEFLHMNQPENMAAYRRTEGGDAVIVCANFGRGAETMDIPFGGTWSNVLTGATFTDSGEERRPVELAAGEVAVFVKTAVAEPAVSD